MPTFTPAQQESAISWLISLCEKTKTQFGKRYLEVLVEELQKVLQLDIVMVGLFDDPESPKAVVPYVVRTEIEKAHLASYDLAGTPCAATVADDFCFYARDVASKFPGDRWLVDHGIQSYLGVRLVDQAGSHVGILVGLSRSPFAAPQTSLLVFLALGRKIASELQSILDLKDRFRGLFFQTHHTSDTQALKALLESKEFQKSQVFDEISRIIAGEWRPIDRAHALVIEDELELLEVEKEYLEESGFAVTATNSPQKALRLLMQESKRFSVVVTDSKMPGMRGEQLIAQARDGGVATPFLLVSGNLLEHEVSQISARYRGIGFLPKPFDKNRFVFRVGEMVSRRVP